MSNKAKGISLAVTAAVLWGIMGVFVRGLSAVGLSSFDITFLRCLPAGIVFMLYTMVKNPQALKVDAKGLIICLIYGAVAYGISFMSYNISVQRIPVAVATVLMFMSPVWVMMLGALVFHEKLRARKVIVVLICILGAAMVSNLIGANNLRLDAIGLLAGVINGFGVALQLMIPRYFADKYEKDTMLVYGFFGGALLLLFFTDFPRILSVTMNGNAGSVIVDIVGIGIFCTMIANVAYVKSTAFVNTNTTSILSALEVVVGSAVGVLLFNESMGLLQIAGAVIIVGASLGSELLGNGD